MSCTAVEHGTARHSCRTLRSSSEQQDLCNLLCCVFRRSYLSSSTMSIEEHLGDKFLHLKQSTSLCIVVKQYQHIVVKQYQHR